MSQTQRHEHHPPRIVFSCVSHRGVSLVFAAAGAALAPVWVGFCLPRLRACVSGWPRSIWKREGGLGGGLEGTSSSLVSSCQCWLRIAQRGRGAGRRLLGARDDDLLHFIAGIGACKTAYGPTGARFARYGLHFKRRQLKRAGIGGRQGQLSLTSSQSKLTPSKLLTLTSLGSTPAQCHASCLALLRRRCHGCPLACSIHSTGCRPLPARVPCHLAAFP